MGRIVWVCVWALCCGALAGGGLAGCKPSESTQPRLDLVTPQPAYQLAELELFGEGFGEWSVYDNQVLVNGECADVLVWSDRRVRFVVPSGVGVGARTLELVTADGQRLTAPITLQGPDRPRQPKLCASIGGPVTVDPDATDAPDATDPTDAPDAPTDASDAPDPTDTPDPTDAPDVPPDVPDVPDVPTTGPYFFVSIEDQGFAFEDSPGADIDAVVLRKPDGGIFYADSVQEYATFSFHPFTDAFTAIGPPDAFIGYPDTSECLSTKGFVSLGGAGGYLIVGFPVAIESGDVLEVLEVGLCRTDGNTSAAAEPFLVSISPQPAFSVPTWLPLFFSEGGFTSFIIPDGLP